MSSLKGLDEFKVSVSKEVWSPAHLDDNKDEINKIQCIPFHVIDGGCGYVTDWQILSINVGKNLMSPSFRAIKNICGLGNV